MCSSDLLMFPDQFGKISVGGRIGMFAAVTRRGLDDENGFVSDNATDLIVFAVAGLDGVAIGENAAVAFAGSAQVRSGIFEKGDEARFIVGGGFGQRKEARRLRAGQGTDDRPVGFAEALDAGGFEGDGFDLHLKVPPTPQSLAMKSNGSAILHQDSTQPKTRGITFHCEGLRKI